MKIECLFTRGTGNRAGLSAAIFQSFELVVDADLNDCAVEADNGFEIVSPLLEVDFVNLLPLVLFLLDLGYFPPGTGGFDNCPDVAFAQSEYRSRHQ